MIKLLRRLPRPRRALLAAFALGAAGCATLSEEECLTGAWGTIGFEDGAQGRPPNTVGDHGEACAAYGVPVDFNQWRAGYEAGLKTYCTYDNGFAQGTEGESPTGACEAADPQAFAAWRSGYEEGLGYYCSPDNGFEIGARGQSRSNVCRGPFGEGFEIAYDDGRQLRAAIEDFDEARDRLRDAERDVERAVDRREAALRELGDEQTTDERRAELQTEIEDLDEEIEELRGRRREARRELEDEEDDLETLESLFRRRYAMPAGLY